MAGLLLLLALQTCLGWGAVALAEVKKASALRLTCKVTFDLRAPLLHKAASLSLRQLDTQEVYDWQSRAFSAVSRGVVAVDDLLASAQSIVTAASYSLLLVMTHWSLALLVPLFSLPGVLTGVAMARRNLSVNRGLTPVARRVAYLQDLIMNRHGAKEIRIFGTFDYLFARFRESYWKETMEKLGLHRAESRRSLGLAVFQGIIGAGASTVVLLLTLGKRAGLGTYVAQVQAVSGIQSSMQNLAQKSVQLYQNALFMIDYSSFLALPEEDTNTGTAHLSDKIRQVTVENLTFFYPGRSKPALEQVSFGIRSGEMVAIVGENGSGKTTLAKCLVGLYAPSEGRVCYDGIDLQVVPRRVVYDRVATLFQDFVQYQFTVRENVGLGSPGRIADESAMWDACRAAGSEHLVRQLDGGLNTQLGVMFGAGVDLSAGEWQRVALSRVFFRDAQIVLLDEPTAALDPESELHVYRRVRDQCKQDRTVFLISHRLGICREVDRVLVMKGGRLVENGNHAALLAAGGEYARMYRMQADLYAQRSPESEQLAKRTPAALTR